MQYEEPSEQNMTDMANLMSAQGCDAASNFSGCTNITGLSPQEAQAVAEYIAANSEDSDDDDAQDEDEENQLTPEQIQPSLPEGVQAVPADWPDADAWPNGLPPDNCPAPGAGCDPNVWPDPNGAKPAGWSDYQWERYQYNWQIYRSSYQPYRSNYQGYSINRRRRLSRYSSGRRRSYSSGRRRSYTRASSRSRSSDRRRSYSSGRRRSGYSSGRRRSGWR